jgi:hypothetical protein
MDQHPMHINEVEVELYVHFLVYDQYMHSMKEQDRINSVLSSHLYWLKLQEQNNK